MCFSNLPVEFDDEGNPYLAEEAEEVDGAPGATETGCGCSAGAGETALDETDPESAYEAIMATMPGDVREQVAGTEEAPDRAGQEPPDQPLEEPDTERDRDRGESAESD